MMIINQRQFLIDLGFTIVGHWNWNLSTDTLTLNLLSNSSKAGILYAFVSDDTVLYLGKSVKTLSIRMKGYQKPGSSQFTNKENHKNIGKVLQAGSEVIILAFEPDEQIEYRGLPVSLSAGLEDVLIERLQPEWNKTGIRVKKS